MKKLLEPAPHPCADTLSGSTRLQTPLLEVEGLRKCYGNIEALKHEHTEQFIDERLGRFDTAEVQYDFDVIRKQLLEFIAQSERAKARAEKPLGRDLL